ncbi:MAG TPA: ABC transporter substrate-binding protein [Spirochaetales bacterium]|nr:ABC transporter substrate-binding protein [Spirochaetales bacterium]HRY53863.1 ABC transporter substrate-binding protein [Spirochaetia bacterium]HRZ64715.1 ABC transporter substrate-binding protein [Spirochaetia bacterium]
MDHRAIRARGAAAFGSAALILSLALAGCGGGKTIKLGFDAQMTGPDAYVGQAAKYALEDRVKEINAAGGIKGHKLELITYDSRSEPAEAITAAKRLMEQDRVVGIIGPEWSAAAIPLGPMAAAAKTPIIATTASNTKVTVGDDGKVQPYMFRTCFIDPYQGTALADFAYKELGKRKAAFITDVSAAYSTGIQSFFEEQFTKLGGAVVAKEGYQTNDTEFRAQISKISKSGADLLVVPTSTYRDIALVAKQASALGLKIQYLGVDGWIADELLGLAANELQGAFLSSGLSPDAPQFAEFNAAFEKAHNMKANVYAYYALDALYAFEHAIGEAIAKDGKATGPAIRDALEGMKDVPVFTSKMTVEPETHNPHNKPVIIMTIEGGKWKDVKVYEPKD